MPALRWGLVSLRAGHYAPGTLRRDTSRPRSKASPAPSLPTVRSLLRDVAEGIRVLQTRDGLELSNEQIEERARNIVAGLLGNYRIRPVEAREPKAQAGDQMDLLEQLERRAEARNNGRPGRA
jgi:hypothetical protein